MQNSEGKYVWHVDSDDFISTNCLKKIVDICEERQLDVLEFGYIGARNLPISIGEPPRTTEVVNGKEYINKYFLWNFGAICPIWRRVYKKDFLEANGIVSPPINMGEDESYALNVFVVAKRVSFEPKDWYIHRVNTQSLVGDDKRTWNANKWYEASMVCSRHLNVVYQKLKRRMSPDIEKKAKDMIIYDLLYWQKFDSIMSEEAKSGFWKLCRHNFFGNLFVFKYLNNKKKLEYLRKVLHA